MTIPLTYSNASSKTLQRICTALADGKDPYAAARAFDKNPAKSLFNEGWKLLGFTDLYADQNKGKDEFTCAVLTAVSALSKNSADQARETFKVCDALGLGHEWGLSKTKGQITLFRVVDAFLFHPESEEIIRTYNPTEVAFMEATAQEAAQQVENQFSSGITSNKDEVDSDNLVNLLANDKKFQLRVASNILTNAVNGNPDAIVAAAGHILGNAKECKNEDVSLATSTLTDMVSNVTQFPHVAKNCAFLILKSAVFFTPDTYRWAANYIFSNIDQYQKEEIRACAKYVIKNDNYFSRDIVMLAIDQLCEDEKRSGEVTREIARAIVNKHRPFFKIALQSSHAEFASFYANQDKLRTIKERVTVISMDGTDSFGRYINVNNKITKKREKRFDAFYGPKNDKSKINGASPIKKRTISIRNLWIKGYFEVAIHASNEVAEYLIANRKHSAIKLWSDQQKKGT